jgi:hypothetical protein
MAVVHRVGLFSREIVERLSLAGIEMLLTRVAKLSEGQVLGDDRYYGSTMLTIDVRELDESVHDTCDVATAMRLARLLAQSEALRERVRALAHSEAVRVAGQPLDSAEIDVRVRAEGSWLFVDVDVEACVLTAASA